MLIIPTNAASYTARNAFSLVELSIVLVILGLLVGGILSGQSLIHAAELRSITKERDQIVTATQTFRDKYFQLPGDFSNATRFWGWEFNGSYCTNSSGASLDASGNGACDGDGNGQIGGQIGPGNVGFFENAQFWYHLKLAGLLMSSANGLSNSPTQDYPSRFGGGLWSIHYCATDFDPGCAALISSVAQNILTLGSAYGNAVAATRPLMLPEDAYNIDTKLDDGLPATGSVVQQVQWAASDCYTGNAYTLTTKTATCILIFYNQF